MNQKNVKPKYRVGGDTPSESIWPFLLLTFAIAGVSFAMMLFDKDLHSPQGFPGLLVWLLAIWSPNLAILILRLRSGGLFSFLKQAISAPANPALLSLTLLPLVLLLALCQILPVIWPDFLTFPGLILLVGINLFMGPLGEEFGWRGFLYPALRLRLGWLGAALLVGIIWGFWHAPLWFIESPQSEIPFAVFLGNVMAFSVLMSILRDGTGPSLVGPILMHLSINVAAGLFGLLGMGSQAEYWTYSLLFMGGAAILALVVYQAGRNIVRMEPTNRPLFRQVFAQWNQVPRRSDEGGL